MKITLAILWLILCPGVLAQSHPRAFPAAAIAHIEREAPGLESAVQSKDRSYFEPAMQRAKAFLEAWGINTNPVAMETYPVCFEAVLNSPMAGMCRITTPGVFCEPTTFLPKVARDVASCREQAAATKE